MKPYWLVSSEWDIFEPEGIYRSHPKADEIFLKAIKDAGAKGKIELDNQGYEDVTVKLDPNVYKADRTSVELVFKLCKRTGIRVIGAMLFDSDDEALVEIEGTSIRWLEDKESFDE